MPSVVTELGIEIFLKLAHCVNASDPIDVIFLPSDTEVRLVQYLKASLGMLSSPSPMRTVSKLVQP